MKRAREGSGPGDGGPAKPREAASVMLLRRPDFVYMTARPTTLRVAAGFYVFPGGRVDPGDETLARRRPKELSAAGLPPGCGRFVAAAVREVFEEVGLLLARDREGRALWRAPGAAVHRDALAAARRGLNEGRTDLPAVLAEHDWRVAADELAYVSRWVTPPAARRRFDTRFFVADVTGCVPPDPYAPEIAAAEWVRLPEAAAREERGALPLMRPTRALLHTLAEAGNAEDILALYRRPDSPRLEVLERNTPEVLEAVLASQGVRLVPVPSPTLPPATTTNVYVVAAEGEGLVVDAGDGGEAGVAQVAKAWEDLGRPAVQALVLTHDHRDHAGAAAALARRLGCPVAAHAAAEDRLRRRGVVPDIVLRGGEQLAVGRRRFDVLHTPGHASDHIALHEAEAGLLFSGDNVVGRGSTWVGPPDGDMQAYLRSLERLARLPVHIIAPGHGPLLDDGPRRLRDLIARRLEREAELLAALQGGPRTPEQLFVALYGTRVPPGAEEMARRTVRGHLVKLLREGKVRAEKGPDGQDAYRRAGRDIRP